MRISSLHSEAIRNTFLATVCRAASKSLLLADELYQNIPTRSTKRRCTSLKTVDLSKLQDSEQTVNGEYVARAAAVSKLEAFIRASFFKSMQKCSIRQQENNKVWTETVSLHLASREGKDFKLEVCMYLSVSEAISQALKNNLTEELKSLLSDYLFQSREASNWRKGQIRDLKIGTDSITVSSDNRDYDSKVEVIIDFERGRRM
jgi:hypothetical protein